MANKRLYIAIRQRTSRTRKSSIKSLAIDWLFIVRSHARARVSRRDLCPATYLAALFTGQEAVCRLLARSPLLFCDIIADPVRPRSSRGGLFLRRVFYLASVRKKLARSYPTSPPGPATHPDPGVRALSHRPSFSFSFSLFLSAISPVSPRIARFYGSPARNRVSIFMSPCMRSLPPSPSLSLSLSLSLSVSLHSLRSFDRRKCIRSSKLNWSRGSPPPPLSPEWQKGQSPSRFDRP